jgi:hypothetical protein
VSVRGVLRFFSLFNYYIHCCDILSYYKIIKNISYQFGFIGTAYLLLWTKNIFSIFGDIVEIPHATTRIQFAKCTG